MGERALDAHVCHELVGMLESVVAAEGTGKLAAIPGYRVAGKTGTAWKATAGGYSTDRYMAVFGGVAPSSEPRLAAVVVIDEPSAGQHMGGQVAAPVFSQHGGRRAAPAGRGARSAGECARRAARQPRARHRAHGGAAMSATRAAAARPLAELAAGFAEVPAQVLGERSDARQPRCDAGGVVSGLPRRYASWARVRSRSHRARGARGALRARGRAGAAGRGGGHLRRRRAAAE